MTEETIRLEDLKEAWARLDERVDVDIARMAAVTDALAEDRARTLVRRAIWPPAMELAVTAAGALLVAVGLFRSGSAVFLGSSIFVLALFAALITSAVWQITTIAGIDAAAPVVATQRQVGRVRALRIFETKWMLLLSPVLWAPFLVVVVEVPLRLFFGVERAVFTPGFVLANVLIGSALTAILFWFSRRLADRLRGSAFLRNLLDDFAGRRLTAARAFLDRLDGFERD